MRSFDLRARSAITTLALLCQPSPASPPPTPYEPLTFLIGHCWKGTFAGDQRTDQHCFSWIYGGKFVRDEHVVRGADGRALQSGESIYLWDASSGQLQYLYVESSGGFVRGAVSAQSDALVFPPASYIDPQGGKAQTVRSRWQRTAEDVYEVLTEFQAGDGWVLGFKARMQRVKDAAAS
jgi:hypothetical protein